MGSHIYVDVHAHLYEYDYGFIVNLLETYPNLVIVAVSDDLESSKKTLELAQHFPSRIIPCLGLHPWEVGKRDSPVEEAKKIVELALDAKVACLGEIGLDTKFVGHTIELQRQVFNVFLEAARDYNLFLNLHTAGTWEEVYRLLYHYDIKYANFHWYTGPLSLLPQLRESNYTISINPAIRIQRKHRQIVSVADLDMMLTESDAPYEYKGLMLKPSDVIDVVEEIARIKGLDIYSIAYEFTNNLRQKLKLLASLIV
ncbi:MAG TPA: TatD family deoxyribonuclease [Pyrodictiaceae archaeon]|nr:TatD family deoxyribonuclease [Pyrodictiaceae archaeon]HIQ11157.1 TatD family deoxyribonuclease [Pyrodictium sp.]HIQ56151.1 TatD family deoxyribonuclease [Pyrodictium sp.]